VVFGIESLVEKHWYFDTKYNSIMAEPCIFELLTTERARRSLRSMVGLVYSKALG
jgi:hypothetical protein